MGDVSASCVRFISTKLHTRPVMDFDTIPVKELLDVLSSNDDSTDDSRQSSSPTTCNDRREKRMRRNRESARESRERKRQHIIDIELRVVELKAQVELLQKENDSLRLEREMILLFGGVLPSGMLMQGMCT